MTLIPHFCVRPLTRQRALRSSFFSLFGSMPGFGLIALLGLLALSSSARAQTDDKPKPEIQAYTIVATPDGSSLCRDATPQEKERIANAPERGENLRLINHLEYVETKDGVQRINVNDPSLPGLKIFLLAEPRLDANPTAKAAFIKAAKNWEDVIKTPMTIYIKVDVGPDFFGDTAHPYGSNTIGSTSSSLTSRNYTDVRTALINTASNANEAVLYSLLPNTGSLPTDSGNLSSMFVSLSIARALGLFPANASATDFSSMPQIGFNSAFNFDYDQSDGISPTLMDFTAVATHEIGHALGFSSTAGDPGPTLRPAVLDLFRFRPGVTDFTNNPRVMTIGGGAQIFFAGSANIFTPPGSSEAGLSTGGPNGSTANGGDGRQSSHWKDDSFGGAHIGIMDPSISNGRLEAITQNDLQGFNYLGYNLENSVLPQGPANDSFASAQVLSGCSGSVTGTNIGATKEGGEPSHAPNGNAGGASVWYRWTAPSTGSVTINTANSTFDTVLAVYTGASIGALPTTVVAKNDDVPGTTTSSVTFNATSGVTYRIVVDGYDNGSGSSMGSIVLNWAEQNCGVTSQPTLQLNQASYNIAEGSGSLDLLVNRSGDASVPVTVNYTTTDSTAFLQNCNVLNGAATSRCDYVGVLGTLHFAAGETSKNISIPVVDDTYLEGAESFFISLNTPSAGAIIGTNQQATITVTDNSNDVAGIANPIVVDNNFFVRQHYIDFLSREPDPLSAGWITILNQCGAGDESCRLNVSQGIYGSPEFRDRGYFIYKFYSVSLGRKPSYDEFNSDRARVSGFQSAAELEQSKVDFIADFMARAEFANTYNGLTNNAYVQRLYDTAGVTQVTVPNVGVLNVAGMQQSVAQGKMRATVLREIAESAEVSARFNTESTVVMHYFGYLRRDPDGAYQAWINNLTSPTGGGLNALTSGFINSPEYRARFGQ